MKRRVLLDTSIIIEFIRLKDKAQTPIIKLTQEGIQLAVSIVTYFEAYAGRSIWEKIKARKTLEKLFAGIEIIGLDVVTAEKAGELRAKHNLSAMDALIAATALSNELHLVTINIKDFKKVPELNLFNI